MGWKRLTSAAAGLAVIGGFAAIGPVQAWSYVGGSCSDSDSDANFGTYYTLSSGQNRVDLFEWALSHSGGGLGNHNNVNIQHKRNRDGAPDVVKYQWTSQDNVEPGYDTHNPSVLVQTADGNWAHTRFEFDFDTSGPDDNCNGDTANFR